MSWVTTTTVRKEMQVGYLLVDEFAALRIALDKKNLQKSMTV